MTSSALFIYSWKENKINCHVVFLFYILMTNFGKHDLRTTLIAEVVKRYAQLNRIKIQAFIMNDIKEIIGCICKFTSNHTHTYTAKRLRLLSRS